MSALRNWPVAVGLIAGMLLIAGCPSAYQRAYQQETDKLEDQQRVATEQAEAAHAQAQRYAAVIYFAVGSSTVDADGERELRWFVQQMVPYPQAIIEVQGFADDTGVEAKNQDLSFARAGAVASYLNTQGIGPARIMTQGFGTRYPAESNASTKGRRNNRRVEVTVR
jgi:outer membrane protein OmpA-like peptidoglycan-associated protein